MTLADQIREFVSSRYVAMARVRGAAEVEVRAGRVHREMGLSQRMPAVCAALDAARFQKDVGVVLLARTGPRQGSTVRWKFALSTPAPAVAARLPLPPSPSSRGGAFERQRLEALRDRIVATVRALEGPQASSEQLGEQVRRLKEAKQIPETTARLIFVVLGLRNRVVYDQRDLTDLERSQLDDTARAIERWLDAVRPLAA